MIQSLVAAVEAYRYLDELQVYIIFYRSISIDNYRL